MNSLHILLIFHLLGAAIWVGGHLVLAISILPEVIRRSDTKKLLDFETKYERVGMPALLVLVTTGVMMGYKYGVSISHWFSFSSPIERVVSTKLILLAGIILLALSAQFRVLPALKRGEKRLSEMGMHIVLVTLLSIAMLILGSFVRYGGI